MRLSQSIYPDVFMDIDNKKADLTEEEKEEIKKLKKLIEDLIFVYTINKRNIIKNV